MPARTILPIVFAIVLVDMLGVGILIPIIPLLFADPSYPYHLALNEDTGYLLLGALTALYPFAQFIAMPILGQLSDTFGRKPLLAFSLFGSAIAYACFALGIIFRNIPLLFLARALDGVTGGSIAVAQAAVADVTPESDRIRNFGFVSAANGIGFILGPLIGAFLSEPQVLHLFGAPTPFWFAAGISALNMLAVVFLMPETLKQKTKHKIRLWQSFSNIRDAATRTGNRRLFMTSFLFQCGFAFIITFFGVYLVSRFGFGQSHIGYLFAFVGLLLAFTQLTITGPLSKRTTSERVIPAALALMAAALVGVYFARTEAWLVLLIVPAAISAGLILTNLTAQISTSARAKEQGSALGINSSVQALAQSLPPLFAGAIAAIFAPTTPVLFAAATIAAAALFFTATKRRP